MIQVKKYDLPDFSIYESEKDTFCTWQPEETFIVIGASNKPEDSLNEGNILAGNIPVYKRPSGGQAVVLTPNTIVIAMLKNETGIKSPKAFFQFVNSRVIAALEKVGVKQLSQKGISDIAIGEKKILGSSIYRNKEKNFYHAVLNISEDAEVFEHYLNHPVKEPDYRKGRSHRDFVTSLKVEGYTINTEEIINMIAHMLGSKGGAGN